MSLDMRQRLIIGDPSEMLSPVTDPTRTEMIFPYVRQVRLEEDRNLPISILTVLIPPYPAEKLLRIREGNVIRWETGYWEDGIRPLNKFGTGYHLEFEGVITGISKRNAYIGRNAEKLMRHGEFQDSLGIEIEARDYMFVLNYTPALPSNLPKMFTGDADIVAADILSCGNNSAKYSLTHKILFNKLLVNPNNIIVYATTPAQVLWKLRRTEQSKETTVDMKVGIDTYFLGKTLLLRDPNDPLYVVGPYPVFIEGDNVIESNLTPRPGKFIQVVARWYDSEHGIFDESGKYPIEGSQKYNKGMADFPGGPTIQYVDIDDDDSGKRPQTMKIAEDIWTRMAGDGFIGRFSSFGYPPIHRGDIIVYVGNDPSLEKAAIVDHIIKTYDAENARFRQVISPGFTPAPIENSVVGDRSNITQIQIATNISQKRSEFKTKVQRIINSIRAGGGK